MSQNNERLNLANQLQQAAAAGKVVASGQTINGAGYDLGIYDINDIFGSNVGDGTNLSALQNGDSLIFAQGNIQFTVTKTGTQISVVSNVLISADANNSLVNGTDGKLFAPTVTIVDSIDNTDPQNPILSVGLSNGSTATVNLGAILRDLVINYTISDGTNTAVIANNGTVTFNGAGVIKSTVAPDGSVTYSIDTTGATAGQVLEVQPDGTAKFVDLPAQETASNGLNTASGDVELGGTLVKPTTIDLNGNNLSTTDNTSGTMTDRIDKNSKSFISTDLDGNTASDSIGNFMGMLNKSSSLEAGGGKNVVANDFLNVSPQQGLSSNKSFVNGNISHSDILTISDSNNNGIAAGSGEAGTQEINFTNNNNNVIYDKFLDIASKNIVNKEALFNNSSSIVNEQNVSDVANPVHSTTVTDGTSTNVFDVKKDSIGSSAYPSTRDDSATTAVSNLIYTDPTGAFKSAPLLAVLQSLQKRDDFATSALTVGQTVVAGTTVTKITDVYRNGLLLNPNVDYTGQGTDTATLTDALSTAVGAVFSETITLKGY